MKLSKFINDQKLKVVSRLESAKYGKTDFGIVKVAFMVAALEALIAQG